MYPNTMKNDVYSSTKMSQNADGTKNAKHTSRDAPRRHLSGHKCMFLANLGSRLGPAGFQNGLRSPPGTLPKLHQSSSRRKNRPNQLPGGSRKVPRHPQGPPRDHFWMISEGNSRMKSYSDGFLLTMMSNLPNIYQTELLVRNGMSGRHKLSKHRPFSR